MLDDECYPVVQCLKNLENSFFQVIENLFLLFPDGCIYKQTLYQQNAVWEDGCDYICVCNDALRGRYQCTDRSVQQCSVTVLSLLSALECSVATHCLLLEQQFSLTAILHKNLMFAISAP